MSSVRCTVCFCNTLAGFNSSCPVQPRGRDIQRERERERGGQGEREREREREKQKKERERERDRADRVERREQNSDICRIVVYRSSVVWGQRGIREPRLR